MIINPNRPIEKLIGDNRLRVRWKLGNVHCFQSVLSQARQARPKGMRTIPVELRRGWALCVLETIAEYRGTFNSVTYRDDRPVKISVFS